MTVVPDTRFARSADGTNLSYQVSGSGSFDLVWLGSGTTWELLWEEPGFARMAARLGTFSRCVWPETRGWGASEGDVRDSFTLDLSDEDLVAVLEGLGIEKAVLVGWSTIGGKAIHFAATHPERVRAVIFIDSCAHYVREDDYPWGYPRERLDEFAAFLQEHWGTGMDLDVTAPSRKGDERLRSWWARIRRTTFGPTYYVDGFVKAVEWDLRPQLSSISSPTLVLHREGDRFIHLGAGRYLAEHISGAKFVVLPGDDHLYFAGDTDALADEIEEFLTGRRSGAESDVVTATVLFTDIVSSTEHQTRVGPREWSRLSDRHDAMVRAALQHHRGREIKTTGDGFLATFDATGRAMHCATEILASAKSIGLDLRAGLHTGDIEVRGDDIAGLPVNIAKRVCDLAMPGEALVTEIVRGLMTGSSFGFTERGQHELKGVPGSWRLYRVVA